MAKLVPGAPWSGAKKVASCFATATEASVGLPEFRQYWEEKGKGCVCQLPDNFEAIVLPPGQNQYFRHVDAQAITADNSHYLICFSRK